LPRRPLHQAGDNLSDGRPFAGERARVGLDVDGGRRIVRANKGLRQALGRRLWRPRFVQRGERYVPLHRPARCAPPGLAAGHLRAGQGGGSVPDLGAGKLSACKLPQGRHARAWMVLHVRRALARQTDAPA
jgi:hypothetical protein